MASTTTSRKTSACEICHRRKVKCDSVERRPCSLCVENNHECRPHERKRKRYSPFPEETRHVVATAISTPVQAGPEASRTALAQNVPTHRPSMSATSFLGRSQYFGDQHTYDEATADAVEVLPHSSLSEEDLKVLSIRKAFDMPTRAVGEALIAIFMAKCYPWMPLVDEAALHESLLDNARGAPVQLMQGVLMAGSRVHPRLHTSSQTFYNRAKVLFFMGYEQNPEVLVITTCLLQWWNPSGPERVSIHNSGYWLRVGVGLAQQIGLHREPDSSKYSRLDCQLRRRTWWVLYVMEFSTTCSSPLTRLQARDCLLSFGQGRPRAINPDDCFLRHPHLDDFPRADRTAMIFVAYVSISSILGRLTEWYLRGTASSPAKKLLETELRQWILDLPEDLRPADNCGVLKPYDFDTRQLYLPYFAAICITHRNHRTSGGLSAAALLASSCIVRLTEDFMARDELRCMNAMLSIYVLVAGLAQLSCYGHPVLWNKAELEVLVQTLEEHSQTWHTAKGSLKILRRAEATLMRRQRAVFSPLRVQAELEHALYFEAYGPAFSAKTNVLMQFMKGDSEILNKSLHDSSIADEYPNTVALTQATEVVSGTVPENPHTLPLDSEWMTSISDDGSSAGYGNWFLQGWEGNFICDLDNFPELDILTPN